MTKITNEMLDIIDTASQSVGNISHTGWASSRNGSRIVIKSRLDDEINVDGDVVIPHFYSVIDNSGMGSNGLTSARHDIFSKVLAEKYPESYDNDIPDELVYSGTKKLTEKLTEMKIDAGKLVLSPTRTYAPVIKKIISSIGNKNINGIIHCSGGAQTKILHFISDNIHVIKDNMFDVPFLFRMIQQESNSDWAEMYKVFNCGHRMELYVEPEFADEIINISNSFNIEAKIIGKVVNSDEKKLTVKSEFGEFNY